MSNVGICNVATGLLGWMAAGVAVEDLFPVLVQTALQAGFSILRIQELGLYIVLSVCRLNQVTAPSFCKRSIKRTLIRT